ncbi:MAG: outer membrane beta-barrel protein [Pseudomonadota bacterium]
MIAFLKAFVFSIGTANAQEIAFPEQFDGAYAGAQFGYGTAAVDLTVAKIPIFDSDATGTTIGLYGGYGWQNNRRYLGVELSAGYSGVRNGNLSPVIGTPWLSGEIERVYGVNLLAKGGRVVGENRDTLVYGFIGPSIIRLEASATLSGVGTVRKGTPYPGLALGLGVEHFFTDSLSGRAQVVHTKYWEVDDVVRGVAIQEYNLDTTLIQVGLTWWFGR